jgi:fructokinase
MHDYRFGIDLGGTKIELLALSADGCEVWRERVATPQGDYQGTLEAIQGLILRAEAGLGGSGSLGIGTPGAVSRLTGRIKNSNSVCLNDQPLREDLERLLGRPVRMANDADCFALSEASDGAGKGFPVVFGVILGTGVGGGIVIEGRLLQGRNAIAGEWGHNPLPWPRVEECEGPSCYCGRRGCIETYLSGPGLAADDLHHGGGGRRGPEIVRAAEEGDVLAESVLIRYEERLARALAHVINLIDPDVIVLGGGVGQCERLYRNVPALWGNFVFSDRVETLLKPPVHGDSSGVRGAAWLWPQAAP